jgi:hypothetical protein
VRTTGKIIIHCVDRMQNFNVLKPGSDFRSIELGRYLMASIKQKYNSQILFRRFLCKRFPLDFSFSENYVEIFLKGLNHYEWKIGLDVAN